MYEGAGIRCGYALGEIGLSRGWTIRLVTIIGIALALTAGLLAIASTPQGLAVGQRDSPTYLASSESLAAGDGYRTPFGAPGKPIDFNETSSAVNHYPPGYPMLLSVGVMMGFDSHQVARVVGVLALSLLALLFFEVARRRGLHVLGSALVGLIAVALSFPYVLAPTSELTYGLLTSVTLALLGSYASERRSSYLTAASIVAALGVAVRSVGLALVATVAIVALAAPGRFKGRLVRATIAGAMGLGVFAVSMAGGSREFAWHPPLVLDLKIMASTAVGWFVPPLGSPTQRVAVLIVGLLVAMMWIAVGRSVTSTDALTRPGYIPG